MLNDLSQFKDEILKTLIFHIPHTSDYIPNLNRYKLPKPDLDVENLQSMDIDVDGIFNIDGVEKHICNFSRIFCDVEKLLKNEPMDEVGRGIMYTHTIDGKPMREFNHHDYWNIITQYYIPYHTELTRKVNDILTSEGVVRIIDCHSYNGFDNEFDFCIGTDDFHTPKYLSDYVIQFFENKGFKVGVNSPYSGTYVPMKFYGNERRVESVMVEVNKKLYCDNHGRPIPERVSEINQLVKSLFSFQ